MPINNLCEQDILNIWERGQNQLPIQRTLIILAAAIPNKTFEDLARLNLGQRNIELLKLYEHLAGQYLHCLVHCSQCNAPLEFDLNTTELLHDQNSEELNATSTHVVIIQNYKINFRLISSADLLLANECSTDKQARQLLLETIILQTEYDGKLIETIKLPDFILTELISHIELVDPYAEIKLDLHCPACSCDWQAILDIGIFLWNKIRLYAEHLLTEIHLLASVYGWHESAILSMNYLRRQCYLNKIRQQIR